MIKGQLFVNGTIDLKGSIHGNVTTKSFTLRTAASIYDNHLLNATIDATKLSTYYLNPLFFKGTKPNKIVKWLE